MDSASAASGIGIQSSLHWYFQQKAMKTGQVFKNAFANRYEKQAQEDCIFVFCWALLCVLLAGSWPDLHCHVWGYVRLFLCPGVASCVERYPSEATVFLLRSSSSSYFFIAGNPLVRQLPRAVKSFSRNGSLSLCSGISVFKNPRIVDK